MNRLLLAYKPDPSTDNDDHIARVHEYLVRHKVHHFRISKTAWIILTKNDPSSVRDALCKKLLKKDTVYVTPIGKVAHHRAKDFKQWMQKHS